MADIIRAILFANAIATSILGLRAILDSQDPSGIDLRPMQFNRDIAPIISNLRVSAWPAIDTRPSRSLPPEENCPGTSPSQAAKARSFLKTSIGGANASIAIAVKAECLASFEAVEP